MDRFIKLHLAASGKEFWLRVGAISGLTATDAGGAVILEPKDEDGWTVRESPAEVLSMIEQRPPTPTVDEDGCCDVCGRDVNGCAACSWYVDPENIRKTRGGEKA